jgi:manganese/zinc/iron transport system permease protein
MGLPAWFWIIAIGALVAASCSIVGCFLVLRRLAMLGDAISHAVLPGIALAFLITKSRNSIYMLIGAAALGLVTAFLVQVLQKGGRVRGDAAIGVTFTSLFAVGVILISQFASEVDLDLDCVLYGVIEYTPLYTLQLGGREWGPQAFWQMLAVFVLCLTTVSLLFKELKLSAFDPEMATAVGINAVLMHYLLMGLVSITTVGAFEPVGAILVVAMLVVPPCTAYLLCDDLKKMLVISVGCGVLSSIGGYLVAQQLDASTAGAMTVVAGFLFVLAFLFSPSHGLVTRLLSQRSLSRSVVREDALQALWRLQQENGHPLGERGVAVAAKPLDAIGLAAVTRTEIGTARRTLEALRRAQMVQKQPAQDGFVLTASGEQAAQELVRRHRAYESYLESLGYPEDHVHSAADRVEHFLSPQLAEAVDAAAGTPTVDPHGKPIPRR